MNIFTIKIIALILMLMDHIGEFFPDSPIWFRWLGRLAAPLFFYALAVGFQHTRNRKKYLLRLYLANVGMVFFNQIMCMLQRKLDYVAYQPKNHNIFTTLFCAGVLICIWENRKEKKKFLTYIGIYIFWQAMLIKLAILVETYDYLWYGNARLETVLRTDYIFPLYCIGSLFVLCSRGQVEAYTVLYSILRNISVDVRRRYPVSDNESIFFLGLS